MVSLTELLHHCTVKLSFPGRSGWGTGFFVAPGLILTCAHVIQQAAGQAVQVQWQSQTLEAVVVQSLPDPDDLALLRVNLSGDVNPPCVYLDEAVRSRDPLYLFGYPDEGDRQGEPRTFNCDGITGGDIPAILFNLGQVRPGMSGSPLLNQRTGKVCGMVKFTRDRASDLGGGAIPTRVILEQLPQLRDLQQQAHQQDPRWSSLVNKPADIVFQPYLSAIAHHYSQQRDLYTPTDALLPLEARTVERQERQEGQERTQEKKVEQFPVLAGLRKYALGEKREHLLLAGRPGSGKSTALRQLALSIAEEAAQNPALPIPVLVQLKGDRPITDLIQAEFRRMKQRVTPEQIDEWLLADRVVLLLDGVNEIPNDDLRRSLAQFREDNPTVPMVFTTRDLSLGGDLGIGKRLEMKPLSPDQMREFVGKYLPEQGDRLLGQLRDRLREIAETPLLLKMLCDVFDPKTGQIPQNKGELFQWFDRDYERFKAQPAVSADFRRFKPEILQHLAFVMMQGDGAKPTEFWLTLDRTQAENAIERWLMHRVSDPAVKAKEWLEDLLEHHLLQVAADPKQIEFHHQLFQEYYAAEALLAMFRDRDPQVCQPELLQQNYLNYLKWTEVMAIVLSLLDDETHALRVVEQALKVDPYLGAKLVGSTRVSLQLNLIQSLRPTSWFIKKLIYRATSYFSENNLIQLLSDEADEELKVIYIKALGNKNSEQVREALFRLARESSNEIRMNAVTSLSKVIEIEDINRLFRVFFESMENARLLNKENVLEFLQSILRRFSKSILINHFQRNEDMRAFLLELFDGNPKMFSHRITSKFKKILSLEIDEDYSDLGESEPWTVNVIDLYKSNRFHSREDLANLEDNKIGTIINNLRSHDPHVLENTLGNIQQTGDRRIVASLTELCPRAWRMKKCYIVEKLGKLLGNICASETLPCLLDGIDQIVGRNPTISPRRDYHSNLVIALGKVGGEGAFDKLTSLLKHSDPQIRHDAVTALAYIQHKDVIPTICLGLKDSDSQVYSQTVGILAELGDPRSLSDLYQIHLEKDPNLWIELNSIQYRCKFYNYKIFQAHLEAQKNEQSKSQNSPSNSPIIDGDYIASDKIQGDKILGNKTETTCFPNATEVKIFERVEHYHAAPPPANDSPSTNNI